MHVATRTARLAVPILLIATANIVPAQVTLPALRASSSSEGKPSAMRSIAPVSTAA
jgi:hypothetical protein